MATQTTISDYFRYSLQSLGGSFQGKMNLNRDNVQRNRALFQLLEDKVLEAEEQEALVFIFQPIESVRSGNIYCSRYGSQRSYYLLLGRDKVQEQHQGISNSEGISSSEGISNPGRKVYRLLCLESPQGAGGSYRWVTHERLLQEGPEREYQPVGYVF